MFRRSVHRGGVSIFRLLVVSSLLLCSGSAVAATGVGKAVYIGGSVPGLPDSAKGTIDTTASDHFLFRSDSVDVRIPWEKINLLEYGQRVGRRIGLAIVISPMFLLSKSRKHFLTLNFQDEQGRQQALVFQLDKHRVRSTLVTLEARTGLRVEFQDNDARFGGESQ
jgi:hypothetical protein